jgi:dATP/dGTP diphosphohydrolase
MRSEHITKDSGNRQNFPTGARRDIEDGKPMYHLIPIKVLDELQQKAGGSPISIDTQEISIYHATGLQRHDLIPQLMLDRLAALYHRGEVKYGANNWQKGIYLVRIFGSMLRHAFQWYWGDTSEDHLAAVIWNATALMWTEAQVHAGNLPRELDDRQVAKTRVVYSWNDGAYTAQHRMMDLDGWLDDETATARCQAYWTPTITVHKINHWLDKKK